MKRLFSNKASLGHHSPGLHPYHHGESLKGVTRLDIKSSSGYKAGGSSYNLPKPSAPVTEFVKAMIAIASIGGAIALVSKESGNIFSQGKKHIKDFLYLGGRIPGEDIQAPVSEHKNEKSDNSISEHQPVAAVDKVDIDSNNEGDIFDNPLLFGQICDC